MKDILIEKIIVESVKGATGYRAIMGALKLAAEQDTIVELKHNDKIYTIDLPNIYGSIYDTQHAASNKKDT